MAKPRIHKGPASQYAGRDEAIYEFTDGKSGGLIALERDSAGRLIVDLYRMDPDVFVRLPEGRDGPHAWHEAGATQVPCAYCGTATAPKRQAAKPWDWPGRGWVTNCYGCAGDAAVAELVHPMLKADPIPFGELAKRLAKSVTADELRESLLLLHATGQAQIIYGQGWANMSRSRDPNAPVTLPGCASS